MNAQFIYAGPSWAHSSFPIGEHSTNLAKEWNIPYIGCTETRTSIIKTIEEVKNTNTNLPIVWLYGEPCVDVKHITGMSFDEFCTSANWSSIREECNQFCLQEIASLQLPVLLIGSHSDVVNCNHPNITVANSSWQKWIAEQAGFLLSNDAVTVQMDDGGDFTIQDCWGGEIVQRYMHNHSELIIDPALNTAVWDMHFFWKELEKKNWFFDVHPNVKANKKFAEFLLPAIKDFLNR